MSAIEPDEDATIRLALEILRRRMRDAEPGPAIRFPDVHGYVTLLLAERDRECFLCLLLDHQKRVIRVEELFRGTLTKTAVYVREIARAALLANAAGVIVVHNHPGGVLEFSQADRALTETIRRALELIEVDLIDHLLVAGPSPPLSFHWIETLEREREEAQQEREWKLKQARASAGAKAAWARRKAAGAAPAAVHAGGERRP